MTFSLPYILILCFYLLLGCFESKNGATIKIRIVLVLTYVLFIGFSGYIGSDWYNYLNYYKSSNEVLWYERNSELGFAVFTKLTYSLGLTYIELKVLIALIQAILLDRILYRTGSNLSLCYAIILAFFPIMIIDLLRNFTSILIAYQAVYLIDNNQKTRGFLIIILAITFHVSAILFFLIYVLREKYISKKVIYIGFFCGLFVYLLQINYIVPIISVIGDFIGGRIQNIINLNIRILEEEGANYGVKLGIIEKVFFLFVFLYKYDYIKKTNIIPKLYANFFVLYIFSYLYFSEMEVLINRFSLLFSVGYVISLSILGNSFTYKLNRYSYTILLVLLLIFKTGISYNKEIYKYSNILIKEDNITERSSNRKLHYD